MSTLLKCTKSLSPLAGRPLGSPPLRLPPAGLQRSQSSDCPQLWTPGGLFLPPAKACAPAPPETGPSPVKFGQSQRPGLLLKMYVVTTVSVGQLFFFLPIKSSICQQTFGDIVGDDVTFTKEQPTLR